MTPKRILYPIPGDDEGGELHLFGDACSKNVAIMCAGFPDDQTVMTPLAIKLSERGILVGVMCLPGYQYKVGEKTWRDCKKYGYTFDEIVSCIREAVKALKAQSRETNPRLTGIFHDWGAPVGSIWANTCEEDGSSDAPDELILIDVLGPHRTMVKSNVDLFDLLVTIAYRFVNALSFLLGPFLGVFSMLIGYGIIRLLRIGPLNFHKDLNMINLRIQRNQWIVQHWIYMSYIYYQMFRDAMLDKKLIHYFKFPKDLNKCPLLYLYGTEKRVMFHYPESVEILQLEHKKCLNKSNAIGFKGGHWLYTEDQAFYPCLEAISDFILEDKKTTKNT